MNRDDKKAYLKKYERAKERYIMLNEKLKGLKSLDYTVTKSSVHKSLGERIEECDNALNEMLEKMDEIEELLTPYDIVLTYKYVLLKTNDEIADIMHYSTTQIKRRCNQALDKLVIPQK